MSDNDYSGIVVCGETVSIDIMLPDAAGIDDIKEAMEEELNVKTEGTFIPITFIREDKNIDINFGEHGRRIHTRIVIDKSQKEDFYNSLRIFCKRHKLFFNGVSYSSLR